MRDLHKASYDRLNHIKDALDAIERYMNENLSNLFAGIIYLQDAVLTKIMIIGEASANVEKALLEKYEYPWQELKDFRNLITHEYYNIHLPAVWQIIRTDLPKLRPIVEKMLKEEFS